jgi:hypothetical protein
MQAHDLYIKADYSAWNRSLYASAKAGNRGSTGFVEL